MTRRRESTAPQSEVDALIRRIQKAERELVKLQQPGRSSVQVLDTDIQIDPVLGELVVHHPGDHPEASASDPIQYYHDGLWRAFGSGSKPTVWALTITDDDTNEIATGVSNWQAPRMVGFQRSQLAIDNDLILFDDNSQGITSPSGHVVQSIYVEEPGWYLLTFDWRYTDRAAGYYAAGIGTPGPTPSIGVSRNSKYNSDADGGIFTTACTAKVPLAGEEFMLFVSHTAGSTQTLNIAKLNVVKLHNL